MRDEKGNSIIENGNYRFENDAEARTAVKQIEELNMTTAEVEICTINIADIESVMEVIMKHLQRMILKHWNL